VLLDDTVFCYATVEITRIHTTLEILLLLQTKVTKIAITRCVFWALMPKKCVGCRGSAPDPTRGAYSDPPDS